MSYFKFRSRQAIHTTCSNVLMGLHKLHKETKSKNEKAILDVLIEEVHEFYSNELSRCDKKIARLREKLGGLCE